jgi:hypothetical protein
VSVDVAFLADPLAVRSDLPVCGAGWTAGDVGRIEQVCVVGVAGVIDAAVACGMHRIKGRGCSLDKRESNCLGIGHIVADRASHTEMAGLLRRFAADFGT